MSHPDTLLLFSGGVDSTFCLWQRVRQGLLTRTHHVRVTDAEGRRDVEAKAVTDILAWLVRNYGDGLIEHTESSIAPGDLGLLPGRAMFGYWHGAILATPAGRQIRTVIVPQNRNEQQMTNDRSTTHYLEFVKIMTPHKVTMGYPIRGLSKRDIIRAMPSELFRLTWWCRRPNSGAPCHVCYNCRLVNAAVGRYRR